MELDGMKERLGMGVKVRLKAGQASSGQDRYGYLRIGEKIPECLKEWADEIHNVGMVIRETLFVQLSASEAEDK